MRAPDLFEPFVDRLDRLGVPYFITGSTAGTFYGEPRLTHDIDLVVGLAPRHIRALVEAFPLEEFYCPPEDVLAIEVRRSQRGHFILIHHETGFKADVYIAFDELHRWALAHRRSVTLEAKALWVAPIEYVILRKFEYFREGGSQKHVRDIRGMLEVSSALVDRALLEGQITRLALEAQWQTVLGQP